MSTFTLVREYFFGVSLMGVSSNNCNPAPPIALNTAISLRIRVCITFTSAIINPIYKRCTIEELVLLRKDSGYAIHEITAQSQGKRFITIREKGTCARNVNGEDISLLKSF
jgi:hypothetical protein